MTDAEKILQALERLETGQQALQATVAQQGKELANLQTDIKGLGNRMGILEQGQKRLKEGQKTLELKVEAFHSEQKRANVEIISTLHEIVEVNATDTEKVIAHLPLHKKFPCLSMCWERA